MSSLAVPSQKVQMIIPDSATITNITQPGNGNTPQMTNTPQMANTPNVVININEPDDKKKKKNENDRQDQEPDRNEWGYLLRRFAFGKDEVEEKKEEEENKRLSFFKKEVRRHVAEFIGSFFVVFFIAGIQLNQDFNATGNVGNIDKGIVSGFLLVGLIFSFGKVSGAHFNPCVTFGFLIRGSFEFPRFISYIIAQFGGAVAGAAVLYSLFGNLKGLGTTLPGPGIEAKEAFGIEIIITFLLITVVLTTAENAQILGPISGIAVGTTFGSLELFAWNLTGASANPWRTMAPTLISGIGWDTYWVYIAGPIVGTILAVLVQRLMVTGVGRQKTQEVGTGDGKNHKEHEELT